MPGSTSIARPMDWRSPVPFWVSASVSIRRGSVVVHLTQTADGRTTDASADSNYPRRTQGYLRIAPHGARAASPGIHGQQGARRTVDAQEQYPGTVQAGFKATTDSKHALPVVWFLKKPAPGLIHHSDWGSQYVSHAFQAQLEECGMVCSIVAREVARTTRLRGVSSTI